MKDDSAKKLVVVDLDGTLLRGNSLHIYIICGIHALWRRKKLPKLARLAAVLTLRWLRLISHRQMKWAALKLIPTDDTLLQDEFRKRTDKSLNTDVKEMLDQYRANGCSILLATAAADTYVPLIWHGEMLATRIADNPEHAELRGTAKRDAVLRYAASRGMTLQAVITDHSDDLPLLMAGAAENIVVCPDAATQMAIGLSNIKTQFPKKS